MEATQNTGAVPLGSFEALVQEMTPGLFRFAYGMVGSNADAEDAVQETWLAVYRSLDTIKDPDRIRLFVYRIASRRCTDILRDRYRRRDNTRPPTQPTNGLSAEMQAALDALSPLDRALVCGRVLEDMSYRELSQILQKPEPTLRKRYERATKKLQTILETERGNG